MVVNLSSKLKMMRTQQGLTQLELAKNRAVPLAFASILKKNIVVPPDPELLGAFGVALMAVEKEKTGLLQAGQFSFESIMKTPFCVEREFKCAACENACPIKVLLVGDKKCFFGGRCNKYTNIRKNIQSQESGALDLVRLRTRMLFEDFAPARDDLEKGVGPRVGIPMCFTVYSLWPLISTFFRELNVPVLALKMFTNRNAAELSAVPLYEAGTAQDADISAVKLFRDDSGDWVEVDVRALG